MPRSYRKARWVEFEERRLLRVLPKTRTPAEQQVDIVNGLRAMVKAGKLLSLHIDRSRISVELPGYLDRGHLRHVSWQLAEKMVKRFRTEG